MVLDEHAKWTDDYYPTPHHHIMTEKEPIQKSELGFTDANTAPIPSHVEHRRPSYLDIHEVQGLNGPAMSTADARGKAMCPMLIYSIIIIGASAFLYGYDNAIVSPVAALEPFVRLNSCSRYD